jgi:chromatin structure-remodeling complex subunit RSC3/30
MRQADYRTWQKVGDLTTILLASGYHQLAPDDNAPFFLIELRKRAMISAYVADKELAIFLGRPPRICGQYCDLTPPLDLRYNEIVADAEERDAATAELNENGQCCEGFLTNRALGRLALRLGIYMENILELSLGQWADNSVERVEKLIAASHRMRAELPPYFLLEDQTHDTPVFAESIHLHFVYLDFLLYRTLFKRTCDPSEALIHTSLEILNILHIIIANQTRAKKRALWLATDVS